MGMMDDMKKKAEEKLKEMDKNNDGKTDQNDAKQLIDERRKGDNNT